MEEATGCKCNWKLSRWHREAVFRPHVQAVRYLAASNNLEASIRKCVPSGSSGSDGLGCGLECQVSTTVGSPLTRERAV